MDDHKFIFKGLLRFSFKIYPGLCFVVKRANDLTGTCTTKMQNNNKDGFYSQS